jgi:hypothetical protein
VGKGSLELVAGELRINQGYAFGMQVSNSPTAGVPMACSVGGGAFGILSKDHAGKWSSMLTS